MKRIVCLVVCICLSVGLIAVPISNAASCEENSRKSFWSLISFERIEELYRAICEKLGFCTEKEGSNDKRVGLAEIALANLDKRVAVHLPVGFV